MQINLKSPNLVELQDADVTVLLSFGVEQFKQPIIPPQLLIASVPVAGGLYRPGEYEFSNVQVVAVESKPKRIGQAELFKISFGGYTVLAIIAAPGELTREDLDLIDGAQIVIYDPSLESSEIEKLIKKIDPYKLVVLANKSDQEIEKALGLTSASKDKKFKLQLKDLELAESSLELLLLG